MFIGNAKMIKEVMKTEISLLVIVRSIGKQDIQNQEE